MTRVAILIDGDNIGAGYAGQIASLGHKAGQVVVHRAYADATNGSGWNGIAGVRLMHAGSGKNAADLLLSIDAIELALTGRCEIIVLASSDGDFTHCATRLRERGFAVVGVGEAKAPESFRRSCTRFEDLAPVLAESKAPVVARVTELDRNIRTLIAKNSQKGMGIRMALLGPQMNKLFGTRISTYPERTWRAYFSARPMLFDLDPRGPDAHVRFRPEGFLD